MTSREALNNIQYMLKRTGNLVFYKEEIEAIRSDLELLEILKNKLVFPLALMSLSYEFYNKTVTEEQQLTQEEYDKIKGWLRDDK